MDVALATGDAELLDHVRAHTDPVAVLAALLDDSPTGTPDNPVRASGGVARPPSRSTGTPADRIRARVLALEIDDALTHARDLNRARDLAHDLTRAPAALPVDASDADLAGAHVSDGAVLAGVLDGVVWDEGTRWPPHLLSWNSETCSPGTPRGVLRGVR
ncbi:hypothetical protein OHR68_06095 [Spirillospora sp. NBC_00431]